jgi:hypothetical protein
MPDDKTIPLNPVASADPNADRDDASAENALVEQGPAPDDLEQDVPLRQPDPTEAPLPADDLDRLIEGDSEMAPGRRD